MAAAAATGGGAAILKQFEKKPVIDAVGRIPRSSPPPQPRPTPPPPPIVSDIIPTLPAAAGDDLFAQLAALAGRGHAAARLNDQLLRDLAALQTAEGRHAHLTR